MIISAGFVIIKSKKLLLLKPKGVPAIGHFSIPKGMIEDGETLVEAAIRETYEETSLLISKSMFDGKTYFTVPYINKGILTKVVNFFIVRVPSDFCPDVLPASCLQRSEVEHAEFYNKNRAMDLIFWRFRNHIKQIEF